MLVAAHTGALLGMVGAATAWDVAARRIPNALVGSGMILAFALAWSLDGYQGLLHALAGCGLALALLIGPFALHWLGGGDVKLAMAIGAFVGPAATLSILLVATALHGAVSLLTLFALKAGWVAKPTVPAGLSFALATVGHVAGLFQV